MKRDTCPICGAERGIGTFGAVCENDHRTRTPDGDRLDAELQELRDQIFDSIRRIFDPLDRGLDRLLHALNPASTKSKR